MSPLLPLALSAAPELIRALAADRTGTLAQAIADAVRAAAGTADPAEARRKLQDDPALAEALRQRLAEIALSAPAEPAPPEPAPPAAAARAPATAWGAPAVSILVTLGFLAVMLVLAAGGMRTQDAAVVNIVNIAIGALATAFATVVNFWLGSSQGSRDKDAALARGAGK